MDELSGIEQFGLMKARDLRNIAAKASVLHGPDDVLQEAWFIAAKIEARRGRPVDFANADDQKLLLAWLYNKFVKFEPESRRRYVSLSTDPADEKAVERYAQTQLSSLEADPLVELQAEEEYRDEVQAIRASYSEAAAYLALLDICKNSIDAAAVCLGIAASTFRVRMERALERVRLQPSLFDGIEILTTQFVAVRHAAHTAMLNQRELACQQLPLMLGDASD